MLLLVVRKLLMSTTEAAQQPGQDTLTEAIRGRRSIRRFLPDPVPRSHIEESLALAQLAPSNSNIQPWRLVMATGGARARLRDALLEAAARGKPNVPPLPQAFQHHR